MKKALAILAVMAMVVLTGCGTEKMEVSTGLSDPNPVILHENVIHENVLHETILYENVEHEHVEHETILHESIIR